MKITTNNNATTTKKADVRATVLDTLFDGFNNDTKAIVKNIGLVITDVIKDETKDIKITVSKKKEFISYDADEVFYSVDSENVNEFKPLKADKDGNEIADTRKPFEITAASLIANKFDTVVERTKSGLLVDIGDEQFEIKVIVCIKELEIKDTDIIKSNC